MTAPRAAHVLYHVYHSLLEKVDTAVNYEGETSRPLTEEEWAQPAFPTEQGTVALSVPVFRYGYDEDTITIKKGATVRDVLQAMYDFYHTPVTAQWLARFECDEYDEYYRAVGKKKNSKRIMLIGAVMDDEGQLCNQSMLNYEFMEFKKPGEWVALFGS